MKIETDERIYVRYDGNSYDFKKEDLDIPDNFTDSDLINAVSKELEFRLEDSVDLSGYEITKFEQNGVYEIHPQAKFGKK